MSSSSNLSSIPVKLPVWAQVAIGSCLIGLVILIASTFGYVSAWDEEDSNYYDSAKQALKMRGINPSAPTAFIFWEQDCQDCEEAVSAFEGSPSNLRVYGVHLSKDNINELKVRDKWLKVAPSASQLVIDEEELLQTSFRVRSVPSVFIYLPKQKKIYSYLGNVRKNYQRMLDIIASE